MNACSSKVISQRKRSNHEMKAPYILYSRLRTSLGGNLPARPHLTKPKAMVQSNCFIDCSHLSRPKAISQSKCFIDCSQLSRPKAISQSKCFIDRAIERSSDRQDSSFLIGCLVLTNLDSASVRARKRACVRTSAELHGQKGKSVCLSAFNQAG